MIDSTVRVVRIGEDALDVRHYDKRIGTERAGDGPSGGIRIDVVGRRAIDRNRQRCDDWKIIGCEQRFERSRIDGNDLSNITKIGMHGFGDEQIAVLSAQSNRRKFVSSSRPHQTLVDCSAEDRLGNFQGECIGDAQAIEVLDRNSTSRPVN